MCCFQEIMHVTNQPLSKAKRPGSEAVTGLEDLLFGQFQGIFFLWSYFKTSVYGWHVLTCMGYRKARCSTCKLLCSRERKCRPKSMYNWWFSSLACVGYMMLMLWKIERKAVNYLSFIMLFLQNYSIILTIKCLIQAFFCPQRTIILKPFISFLISWELKWHFLSSALNLEIPHFQLGCL